MNYREAKTLLDAPLRFGDDQQIRAAAIVSAVDKARIDAPKGFRVPCWSCEGTKKLDCPLCDGEDTCTLCKGAGRVSCANCQDGYQSPNWEDMTLREIAEARENF